MWAHLIWYSHYPPTMHSHDRLTPLISHSFRQQLTATMWAWRPVMVAEAFNGSVTVSGLCRTLPFAQFKSVNQPVLGRAGGMPLMLTTDCSIQDSFYSFSYTWTKQRVKLIWKKELWNVGLKTCGLAVVDLPSRVFFWAQVLNRQDRKGLNKNMSRHMILYCVYSTSLNIF